ncbi:MAG: hypothetical protein WA948_08290, partial [Pontixanthobacter sp.]
MTLGRRTRHAGALGVTALLGFGCTQANDPPSPPSDAERGGRNFPERETRTQANDNAPTILPRPSFGPVVGKFPADSRAAPPMAATPQESTAQPPTKPKTERDVLLASVSERPIAWAETVPLAKTPELPPPELAPPPPSPANVTADTAPPAAPPAAPPVAPPVALPATDPSLPSPIALSDAADAGLDALSDDAAPEETQQRAIVAMPADDAAMASHLPPLSPLPAAIVPERQLIPALAAAMPSPRVPIPLVSVDPPRVTAAPIAANDRDIDLADASADASVDAGAGAIVSTGAKARAVAQEGTAGENFADATAAPNPPRTATLSDFAGRAKAAKTNIGQSEIARAGSPSKPSALAAIAPPPRSHTTLGLDRTVPDAAPASAL